MTLLIVNDIAIEAQTMASDIPWENYGIDQVFTAYHADYARAQIKEHPIDVLLCDIEMPDENGLSLIRWLKEEDYDIDCVLLTCHADFAYAREGLSLGCQDYITLPKKYEDIGASVAKVCTRRQQRQDEKRLQDYGKTWLLSHSEDLQNREREAEHLTPSELSERCVGYILEHIKDSNLSVNEIAASVYLNPIYLNRVFKKEKGVNLSQWIIRERMELAGKLLLTTEEPAVAIAEEVGYNNYPYFSTVFKKYFGVTPSQYVKERH